MWFGCILAMSVLAGPPESSSQQDREYRLALGFELMNGFGNPRPFSVSLDKPFALYGISLGVSFNETKRLEDQFPNAGSRVLGARSVGPSCPHSGSVLSFPSPRPL